MVLPLTFILLLTYLHQTSPFWENDTANACSDSGGTWHDKQYQFIYTACAVQFDSILHEDTPVDFNDTLPSNRQQETVGYCLCAEHYCWDETSGRCIPGNVIHTR